MKIFGILQGGNYEFQAEKRRYGFLFDAILSLETKEDCYRFFEDLCTSAELKAMSQRLVVAKMLTEKKVYTEIVKETGASTATISRVKRSLFDNDTYGYSLVLDKMNGKS